MFLNVLSSAKWDKLNICLEQEHETFAEPPKLLAPRSRRFPTTVGASQITCPKIHVFKEPGLE